MKFAFRLFRLSIMAKGGNSRGRNVDGDNTSGLTKQQAKGISFNSDNKPAFLRSAIAALSGGTTSSRPDIPTRPEGDGSGDDEDDAPTIVVLNSKHLDSEQLQEHRQFTPHTRYIDNTDSMM